MASDRLFHFARIAAAGRDWQPLQKALTESALPRITRDGGTLWGAWYGLFGLRSNELIVVTTWPPDRDIRSYVHAALPADVRVVDEADLRATVRPLDATPLTRPGLYVFRFFDVRRADIEEITQLSQTAWTTFEADAAYAAQPQGLFSEIAVPRAPGAGNVDKRDRMLLLTWYDGFESWQASRTPHPDARANFQRRAALTNGTIAFATQLA